jgi:hypothetical protein
MCRSDGIRLGVAFKLSRNSTIASKNMPRRHRVRDRKLDWVSHLTPLTPREQVPALSPAQVTCSA